MIIKLTERQFKFINEAQDILKEDVFVSDIKGHKAQLSYNNNANAPSSINYGNKNSADMINTKKMDANNGDTFIVPLKGGINSYNITSIKGTEVMHYFKNRRKAKMAIEVNGVKNDYDLFLEDPEWNAFLNTFVQKVGAVVNDAMKNFNNKDGFSEIVIYPVPSSSDFNTTMCDMIAGRVNISGLKTSKINSELFKKDLSNLKKDINFINKNKDYYKSRMYKGGDNDVTHEEWIDDTLRKLKNTSSAQDETLINDYNQSIRRLISSYYNKVSPQKLANNYQNLVDAKAKIREKLGKNRWNNAFEQIKYGKGPSIEKRTKAIQDIISPILGKTYIFNNNIEIVEIQPKKLQIKNLTNDTRMGLKNYFKFQDERQPEMERLQNTVFVIFDDNISGGATLSDICQQCKNLGINYIVPITFGEMRTKYSNGPLQINKPTKNGRFENY